VNLALGRVLLAQHRPSEAVPVLRAALRGGLDASNYYVTRTELEDALAHAFRPPLGGFGACLPRFASPRNGLARMSEPGRITDS